MVDPPTLSGFHGVSDRGSRIADASLPAVAYEAHPGAATENPRLAYRRRRPESTALHLVVREHLETFLERARLRDGEGYPQFVEREFRRYLDCGLLCHGFARLRCPECGYERLVAFSCKGRLCPSCLGRRMADTAAYLVDQLLPAAPYRQWVLTFPWVLRFRLAVDRRLMSALLGAYLRVVFSWQRRRGRAIGIRDGQTGAVTFIQRFGKALNVHPHLHSLIPDGLFVPGKLAEEGGPLTFVPLPPPGDEEIEELTIRVARRLTAVVERLCGEEEEPGGSLEPIAAALNQALASSLKAPLPLDLELPEPEPRPKPLCAKVAGFSLHAAQSVEAEDREGLEHLCRYGLRAPFSQQRLSLLEGGRVRYELPHPWPHAGGATELLLEPEEFLRRLAALVPAPRSHQVRYHGIFGSRSKWRSRLPAPPPCPSQSEPESTTDPLSQGSRDQGADGGSPPASAPRRRRRVAWAQLLMRVLFVDALTCPKCGVAMKVLAFLTDAEVVRKILCHLELPDRPPPLAPARLPVDLFYPDDDGWMGDEVPTVGEGLPGGCSPPAASSFHGTGRDPPMGEEAG